ncbi:MAG: T9SS type A sorting domain-containing protein [Calditrichia bacterium]|nr:T9SS type A sorting domain-containing protein [Calditrichia bacterium]
MKIVKGVLMVLFMVVVLGYSAEAQITLEQIDDFEDGTIMGWDEGVNSPNPPQNIVDGGPAGTGDNYLENVSAGGAGAGSKMVMENETQWAGDYVSAGVTYINMDMINLGATDLHMRISIDGTGGQFSTTHSVPLTVSSGWQQVSIPISSSDFSAVGGTDINATLSNVTKIRILSNTSPNWHGQAITATLGVDNITATDGPVSVETNNGISIIKKHSLMQNYPNPFNPTTTINYSISKPGLVEIIIFDMLGKEIETLVKGFQRPNNYSINFNAANLASGMYFYRLRVDNNLVATRKMVLIK